MKDLPETYKGFPTKDLIQVHLDMLEGRAEKYPDQMFQAMGDMIREFRLTTLMQMAHQNHLKAVAANRKARQS